ncbi:efflux RND transporter periplasmic adaptor subunit [Thioalkalivibrio thiocyanodenitrificans]|uniref:efflux RND transporter periplasmic adaptor subunit n=1 Tax=Thioalkalivibrio thiocyanodenitrificans TaxID=243063 RepID=UPI00036453D5|nr:efflux RND transporter periplasmic adaptor subunit [Thioalkalivibrio thiocyanodenitrificans]
MMRIRNGFVAVATAALVGMLPGCESAAQPDSTPPPPAVSVAEVLLRDVVHWDEFTGRIEAAEAVDLRPRVSGYIERVDYEEGGVVEKGDVLFTIDQRPYRAAFEQARAELARAEAQAALARSELARAGRLAESRAISAEEHDQRQAAARQAEANVRAARAALDTAALDLEFTEVRAPISGRAGRARITAGNLAQADVTRLTTIVSLDPVHVYFDGDERAYLRYQAMERNGERSNGAHPVHVALAGDRDFPHEGVLDFMDNHLDPNTGTIRGRALLSNHEGVFTPGLFARVRLPGSGTFHALLVDDKAILTDQDRKYVYVLGEDSRALRRDVRIGRMVEGLRVVESGLEPGDRVLVHGVQRVFFPGMPVQAQVIAMGDPPAIAPDAQAQQ